MYIPVSLMVANLAFLKTDFESLAFFKRVWLFFKQQKRPEKSGFLEMFGLILKIKKPDEIWLSWINFRRTLHEFAR